MSMIDRQRIGAVRTLDGLGYTFDGIEWKPEASVEPSCFAQSEADAMHTLLILRADKLYGCAEGSDEAAESKSIADAVSAFEAKRWPDGRVARGKG